jgi:hypothetical protein
MRCLCVTEFAQPSHECVESCFGKFRCSVSAWENGGPLSHSSCSTSANQSVAICSPRSLFVSVPRGDAFEPRHVSLCDER